MKYHVGGIIQLNKYERKKVGINEGACNTLENLVESWKHHDTTSSYILYDFIIDVNVTSYEY